MVVGPFAFIRGAPGVGKSTVGRLLLGRLQGGAVLEIDRFRALLGCCDWSDRRQHQIALNTALVAASSLAAQGVSPIVVIDTFCRDRLNVARRLLPPDVREFTISLWATAEVLQARLEQRSGGFSDWDQARHMNDEVASARFDRETLLDTTFLSADQVATRILAVLSEPLA